MRLVYMVLAVGLGCRTTKPVNDTGRLPDTGEAGTTESGTKPGDSGGGDTSGGDDSGAGTDSGGTDSGGTDGGTTDTGGETGSEPVDADGDGHASMEDGGGDCDDADPAVHPDAEEVCGNGVDDDCDGSAAPCRVEGELTASDAVTIIYGGENYQRIGAWVSGGGDVDGDGRLDMVIGGKGYNDTPTGGQALGTVSVMLGPLTAATTVRDGALRVESDDYYDDLGDVVQIVPDLDGDGYDEVLAGAVDARDGEGDRTGAAYLFYGPCSGVGGLELADAVIEGEGDNDDFGYALAAGRVAGSSADPALMIGALYPDRSIDGDGAVYLLAGALSGDVAVRDAAIMLDGPGTAYAHFGHAVSSGEDVDGDGVHDLLVSARGETVSVSEEGVTYLFSGPITADRDTTDATARIEGVEELDVFGYSVSLPGDTDADGYADVLVGAPLVELDDEYVGRAYLFRGPVTGTVSADAADARLTGTADAAASGAWNELGEVVAGVGDLDSDGRADWAAQYEEGVLVLYGPVTGALTMEDADIHVVDLTDSVPAALGDIDGDGDDDFAVGHVYEDAPYESAGGVLIFTGSGW